MCFEGFIISIFIAISMKLHFCDVFFQVLSASTIILKVLGNHV